MNPSTHGSILDEIKHPERSGSWVRFQQRYQPTIYRWCIERGLQPADAEDLTQTVLLKMLHVLPGHVHDPEKGLFRSWLKTVVNNMLNYFMRKLPADRAGGGTDCYEKLAKLSDPEATSHLANSIGTDAVEDPDLKQVVENVRATVGEKTWQAFEMLTKFENDAKTVARELGMKLGAVYQAKYRVLELLNREYVNREYAARIVGADNLDE